MLLEEPTTRLHDILDDLQSVFWVLLCAASERFTAGDVHIERDIFEEERPYPEPADGTIMAGGDKKWFL